MTFHHQSVLSDEVLEQLNGLELRRLVDGTLGAGGHSRRILDSFPDCRVLGIDRDRSAIAAAGENLARFGDRITIRRGPFSKLSEYCDEQDWQTVDAILLDIGVSSHQIDSPERGFSHRFDGPLDMRMDQNAKLTASQILNTWSEKDIADILYKYGEERKSRRIAREITKTRTERPLSRTSELKALIERVLKPRPRQAPPATRTFQALRIAVNQELDELETALQAAHDRLRPGGRLLIISFHSLEDRIVKHFFKHKAETCICPPDFPICTCDKTATMKILTKRPIQASENERNTNRRAASAKLRAAEKLQETKS